jgi:hypothetical protein
MGIAGLEPRQLLCNKYLKSKKISQSACKTYRFPFLERVDASKGIFFRFGSFHVGDGEGTRFWEDTWLGAEPLASQYPSLYAIVNYKNVTVANVHQGEWIKHLF